MLPLRARVDLGAMAMKEFSAFPKVPSDCLVSYTRHSLVAKFYPSAEMHSVYSTAPANWAKRALEIKNEILWILLNLCLSV